jgi:Transposase DDE domain
MEIQAIFIYCLSDEILKSLHYKDDIQCKMTTAEVMTFVILSALHYQCNYRKTRLVILYHKYFSKILSQSQLIRRIHQIPEHIWLLAFQICKEVLDVKSKEFIVDSFPVACCQNNKIFRCRLFKGKEYHGYNASKKTYFFGLKVHMLVNLQGIPIEFIFTPGGASDIKGFRLLELDLEQGSRIYADRAYTDYLQEDLLKESCGIELLAKRKKNAKRQHKPIDDFFLSMNRNKIETVFSRIIHLMPRSIQAVTAKGFCLKIFFFIFSHTVSHMLPKL